MYDKTIYDDYAGIVLACMPKSGSTYFTTIVSKLPGFRRAQLVPDYQRREQELCPASIEEAYYRTRMREKFFDNAEMVTEHRPKGFIAQLHLRRSRATVGILRQYSLRHIVLVRNLFDCMVSMRDHLRAQPINPMAYIDDQMRDALDDEQLMQYVCDMIVPWYFNFYASWAVDKKTVFFRYEDFVINQSGVVQKALNSCGLNYALEDIEQAIHETKESFIRLNVGKTGRGDGIQGAVREQVYKMASYYKGYDFSSIGLER